MSVTTSKLRLTLNLDDGKTGTINLPAPINNTVTDPDEGDSIWNVSAPDILSVFAADNGAVANSLSIDIVTTTTTNIATDYRA